MYAKIQVVRYPGSILRYPGNILELFTLTIMLRPGITPESPRQQDLPIRPLKRYGSTSPQWPPKPDFSTSLFTSNVVVLATGGHFDGFTFGAASDRKQPFLHF